MSSGIYHKWTDEELKAIGDRYLNFRDGAYANYIVILSTAKIQKVFSVKAYGSKKKAYLAAKEFRDSKLKAGEIRTTKDGKGAKMAQKDNMEIEKKKRLKGVQKAQSIIEVAARYGLDDIHELEVFMKIAMAEGQPLHQITGDAEAGSAINKKYEEILHKLSTKTKMKKNDVLFNVTKQPKPKDPKLIRWQTAELTTAGKILLGQLDK